MPPPEHSAKPVDLFYSYSHKDDALRKRLETHLSLLQDRGVIRGWHDRRIVAGTEWDGAISEHLERAEIILLLVSADFLASRYCRDVEIRRAMERHEARQALVIPVILRMVDWDYAPFGKLQALPRDGRPVASWRNRDEAFTDVARGVRKAAESLWGGASGTEKLPPGPFERRPVADRLGQLDLVPDLPWHFLSRAHEVDAYCEKLLWPGTRTLVVRGMGGTGKSVLANAVARDERIRRHFIGGIFWISVGQDNAETDSKAMALQANLASRLGSPLDVATLHEGRQHLRELLADRTCLIILDDVWETVDAQWLDVVERTSSSRILITTREDRIVTVLDADEVVLGELTPAQAAELLSQWSGKPVRGDAQALAVAGECGNLPLALVISGAMARDGVSWADIARGLKYADISVREGKGLDPTYDSVLQSIAASVDHLERTAPDVVRRYRDLAVFPPDEDVPESVVALLWARTSGCYPHQVQVDLGVLERYSLLTLDGTAPFRLVSLHDLQHDYLKRTHPNLAGANTQLVEAYWGACRGVWANGPDDGYYYQHLAYHMVEAGRRDELRKLLLDFDWLEAKLRATDVVQLLADFDLAPWDETITLVRDAARLSAHHLARDHTLLRGQLHGRLLGVESAEVQGLLRDTGGRSPWLRCLTPSLTAPGGELIRTLEGHADSARAVVMSGDGTRAVSGSDDNTLKVWDLTTGGLLRTLEGHAGGVSAVAMSGDGTRAVSGSADKTLKVWDLNTGGLLRTLEGHAGWVSAVAMSGDGTRAVSGSHDNTLKVWDLTTGGLLRTLAGHAGRVNAVVMSGDGTRAVSGSHDNTLKVWDLTTGGLLRTLEGHAGWVYAVAMSGDGTRAVSGSNDKTLKVWDLTTGGLLRTLEGHAGGVNAVAMSGDGTRAVSGSHYETLKVWDLTSGGLLRTLEGHAGGIYAVAMSGDGTRAVSGSDDKTLKVWDLTTGGLLRTLEGHARGVNAVAMSGDGTRAVSGSYDNTLKVWDLTTGGGPRTLEGDAGWVYAVAMSGDGTRAVSGSDDKTLKVWDLATGGLLRTLEGHAGWVYAVAMSGDGTRAVSGSDDKTLKVWDLTTGGLLRTLKGHAGWVNAVAMSGDGTRAVSGSNDKTLKVWDLTTGGLLRTLEGHAGWVYAAAMSGDGTRAVSGSHDNTLKVWDLTTGGLLRTLEGHADRVSAVAMTGDGTRAVSGSDDKTLKVWDLTKGEVVATFAADYPLQCCASSPRAETLVAGDTSGRVHLLRLEGLGSGT